MGIISAENSAPPVIFICRAYYNTVKTDLSRENNSTASFLPVVLDFFTLYLYHIKKSKGLITIYKAVIFDLDGTLLDTLGDLHAAVNYALRAFSFPERSLDEVRRFVGNGVVKLMQRATPDGTDEKTDAECLEVFRGYYLEHMQDMTKPYEGVISLIKTLREKGMKTAVVSNKLHQAVYGLCLYYFPGIIDEAIGVSDESERKPSPANVYKAFDRLGVTADECIYIGDSEVDVQTAHNAGIKCIGVTWGFRGREVLASAGADFITDNCCDIPDFFTH